MIGSALKERTQTHPRALNELACTVAAIGSSYKSLHTRPARLPQSIRSAAEAVAVKQIECVIPDKMGPEMDSDNRA